MVVVDGGVYRAVILFGDGGWVECVSKRIESDRESGGDGEDDFKDECEVERRKEKGGVKRAKE